MPELPEVETNRAALADALENTALINVIVRHQQLRWPVPSTELQKLAGQKVSAVKRRAKYLLIELEQHNIIIHLGMSGTLRILNSKTAIKKHDHIDFIFKKQLCVRFNDPRRFGAVLVSGKDEVPRPLQSLGVEPLDRQFSSAYLYNKAKKSRTPIKTFLMNNKIVVGVGNIYAAESLFYAQINPQKPANQLTVEQCQHLVKAVKQVLRKAIKAGGTTLQDFHQLDGKPGYFTQQLAVYGRAQQPCQRCDSTLVKLQMAGRSVVYCPQCQI